MDGNSNGQQHQHVGTYQQAVLNVFFTEPNYGLQKTEILLNSSLCTSVQRHHCLFYCVDTVGVGLSTEIPIIIMLCA